MSERSVVEEQLKKKEAEVILLEEKLKVARVYLRALQDVQKAVLRNSSGSTAGSEADVSLRPGSTISQAREAILAHGAPMYIDDLLVALGKEVSREEKASLTGNLAAYVRKGEVFTRPMPSTFGLVELADVRQEVGASQPPAGFGKTEARHVDPVDDEIPF